MTYFTIKNDIYLRPDTVAELLGVQTPSLYSYENYNRESPLVKENDPNDGRKRGYDVYSVITMMNHISSGKITSKVFDKFPGFLPENNPFLQDFKANPPSGMEDRYDELYQKFSGSVSDAPTSKPVSAVVVANATPRLRAGIAHIVSNKDVVADQDRLLDLVSSSCFGFLEETNVECNKFCKVRGACAEARLTKLREYGRQAVKDDANALEFEDLHKKMRELEKMRESFQSN